MKKLAVCGLLLLVACTNAFHTESTPPIPPPKPPLPVCVDPLVIRQQVMDYATQRQWEMKLIVLERREAVEFLKAFNALEPVTFIVADTLHLYRAGRDRDLLLFIVDGCVTQREWPSASIVDRLLAFVRGTPT